MMTDISWNEFPKVLPAETGEYLVTIKVTDVYSYVTIRNWGEMIDFNGKHRTTWHFYDSEWGSMVQNGVIAWQKLPEPFKKEVDE
ncbi:MAG: hypothetical protein J6U54_16000 [Clostridiales bacterium]|nr:hypothetical protein [Clostridiales bacterium]